MEPPQVNGIARTDGTGIRAGHTAKVSVDNNVEDMQSGLTCSITAQGCGGDRTLTDRFYIGRTTVADQCDL